MKAYTDTERDPWANCLVRWFYSQVSQLLVELSTKTIQQLRASLLWRWSSLCRCCCLPPPQGFDLPRQMYLKQFDDVYIRILYLWLSDTKAKATISQLSRLEATEMATLGRKSWQRWKPIFEENVFSCKINVNVVWSDRWVWLTDESPEHTNLFEEILGKGFSFHQTDIFDNCPPGVFNWSMNYHSTSDVPVPYGRVVPRKSHDGKEESRDFFSEKSKGVALLASNCGGPSGRYNYLDKCAIDGIFFLYWN